MRSSLYLTESGESYMLYTLAGVLREMFAGERTRLGAAVRLIAVTGYGQDQDRARAQQAGFDAHFAKPVSLAQLVADIELARGASSKH